MPLLLNSGRTAIVFNINVSPAAKENINPAAKTFLDWAISDETMDLYSKSYPIVTNGKASKYDGFPNLDPVEQLIENDLVWIAANRESILDKWTRMFDGKSEDR